MSGAAIAGVGRHRTESPTSHSRRISIATMDSTMQNYPLTITTIMRYACGVHGDRTVTTATGNGYRHTTYRDVGEQAARLANALRRLGISGDQRVATFMWNNAEHLTAYLAIPSMGAVLHTLNIRLSPDQIAFIANEAEDQVIIADLSVAGLLAPVLPMLETVHTVIAVGNGDVDVLRESGKVVLHYDDVLAAEASEFGWPELDETSAAAMCYTSGTTGQSERRCLQPSFELSARNDDQHRQCRRLGLRRQGAGHCADVPRQFVGDAVRRHDGGRRDGADRPVPRLEIADRPHRNPAPDGGRGGADDLERRLALSGSRSRPRHLVVAIGDLRRLGGADVDDEDVRGAARCPDRAGVGDDGDLAAGDDCPAAAGRRRTISTGRSGPRRVGRSAGSRRGSSTTTASRCRTTARRSARCRCAGRGLPARTTATATSR